MWRVTADLCTELKNVTFKDQILSRELTYTGGAPPVYLLYSTFKGSNFSIKNSYKVSDGAINMRGARYVHFWGLFGE